MKEEKQRLIVVGAGGMGREIFSYALEHPDRGRAWEVVGFLDDKPSALDGYGYSTEILDSIKDYQPGEKDIFVCGLGLTEVKKKCIEGLKAKGALFLRFVHPTAFIGQNVEIDEGVVICPNVVITCDAKIGKFVIINSHSTIMHDSSIGDWSTLSCHCDVTGYASLGEGVFMGSHASVIPGRHIGANTIVGAGAVVTKRIEEGETVVGIPAHPICQKGIK